jgi:hypothetical protein
VGDYRFNVRINRLPASRARGHTSLSSQWSRSCHGHRDDDFRLALIRAASGRRVGDCLKLSAGVASRLYRCRISWAHSARLHAQCLTQSGTLRRGSLRGEGRGRETENASARRVKQFNKPSRSVL